VTEERKHRGRPSKKLTEWIRSAATPEDKAMLAHIAKHYGDETESAVVRRIVRLEYGRLTAGQPAQAG
jgi:hypothetical protein